MDTQITGWLLLPAEQDLKVRFIAVIPMMAIAKLILNR
jgi:hypothetical protein